MRALLLLLSYLILDSAHTDPCEDHTVLSDTWRSTSCSWTECVWDMKCDDDLRTGWYRFKSSGGWKIPEFRVALGHCSTGSPGWLQGSHPTLEQGEGSGTVCFSGYWNPCGWKREIKIKNCSSYFVYELKPTPGYYTAYCTDPGTTPTLGAEDKSQPKSTHPGSPIPTESPTSVLDSAHTDPCEDHTVLNDSWRSISCRWKECVWDVQCDYDLPTGWYRFKSSGGWKIPEFRVAPGHCSTASPGWLQGPHPTLQQGEGSGTVCFNWYGNPCSWKREIKIKNCSSYFVYELKPTPGCYAAYCTDPNSALTDPCVDHTVLNQPWRSSDCTGTECVRQLQCDKDLVYGWYRFNSSGGWKIPETAVPVRHCSTHRPGWLEGPHPTLEQGEVNRTVCFNWKENLCRWKREIKIKNCSSYFVYELKPTPGCNAAYCTVADLSIADPCVNHTILDQPWRSAECNRTVCSTRKCDNKLNHGWYRFKSSGGWKIPETPIPEGHCSTDRSGWLNGSHPTLEQGVVTRTVCLSWKGKLCHRLHQIKIKNCSHYIVYELKSLRDCDAYCTDPKTAQVQGGLEGFTRQADKEVSSSVGVSPTSGTIPSPTPGEESSGQSSDESSSVPDGTPTSDPQTSPTRTHRDPSSEKSIERSSSVPAGSPTSGKSTTGECGGQSDQSPAAQAGSLIPGFLSLSEEDCEAMDVEVQVMYVGNNKLETDEQKAAYIRQVQDMLRPYLPCKKLELTDSQREKTAQNG